MKKICFLLLLPFLLSTSGRSQTKAQNWTKTDCDGKSHTLFNYLDSGKVVLMQFDMMNCIYCTTAANATDPIYKDYQKKQPGKLLMFSMGYTNSTTCSQMQSWKSSNGYSFSTIEKCPNEVAYYGGMGMPTIVVVGGKDHKIFYSKKGFTSSDTTEIKKALDLAFADQTSGIEEGISPIDGNITISPNPANEKLLLNFNLTKLSNVTYSVYNMLGEKMFIAGNLISAIGHNQLAVNTTSLQNGIYIFTLTASGHSSTSKFIVAH
jgi:hypothetical protein